MLSPWGARRAGGAMRTLRSLLGRLLGRRPKPRAPAPPPAPPPSPPTPAAAAATTTPAALQAGAAAAMPPAAAREAALPAAAALADAPPAAAPAPATPLLGLMAADASGLPVHLQATTTELPAAAAPVSGPAPARPAAAALADAPDSTLLGAGQPAAAAVVHEALLAAEMVIAEAAGATVPAAQWAPPTPERPAAAPAGKHAGGPAAALPGLPAGAPDSEAGQGGPREWPPTAVPKPTDCVRPPRAQWAAAPEAWPGSVERELKSGGPPPAQAPEAPERSLSPTGPVPWPAAARVGSPERGGKRMHGGEEAPEPRANNGGWTDRGLWPGRGSSPADWPGESVLNLGLAGAPLSRPGYTAGAAGPEDEWAVGEGAGATSPLLDLLGSARARSPERALPSSLVHEESPAGGAPAETELELPRPCSLPGAVVLLTEGAAGGGWGDEAGAALPEGSRWGAGPVGGSPRSTPLTSSPPPPPRGWDERAAHAPRGAERAGVRSQVAATGGASGKADAGAMGSA